MAVLWLAFLPMATAWTGVEDAVRALRQGRCEAAVDAANQGLKDGDPEAYFVVGLMHLKGLCIASVPAQAVQYFEPAAKAAHTDSAYMLTMMHGLGLGVPQSYAQAGRWTLAMRDIHALKAGAAPASGAIDAEDAAAWGVIGTVAAITRDRLLYPPSGARIGAESVSLKLRLVLGPDGVHYDFRNVTSGVQDDASSAILRRSSQPHLDAFEAVVEAAIDELPPFQAPRQVIRLDVPYRFNVKAR